MDFRALIGSLLIFFSVSFSSTQDTWKEHSFRAMGFAIFLPEKPRTEVKNVDAATGKDTITVISADSGEEMYRVIVRHYSKPNVLDGSSGKQIVAEAITARIAAESGSLIKQRDLMYGPIPCCEFDAAIRHGVFRCRIFAVGNMLIQLSESADDGEELDHAPQFKKFFESFRFLFGGS